MITTLYQKLKERKYKTYTVCQLPGCQEPLKRLFHQKVKKYCSKDHAKEAQKMYLKEWRNNNRDQVSKWNKRYSLRRKRERKLGIINNSKKNENKKPQAD